MKLAHLHPAFSMITTLFIIVLMATLAGFMLTLSNKVIQETSTQYRKEQAILYAKSYTEYAIMATTAEKCLQNIIADIEGNSTQVKQGQGYHIIVHIQYIGDNSGCVNHIGTEIQRTHSIANILLLDTYVHYRNPEHPHAQKASSWSEDPGITYHRRTLQRL